MEAFDLINMFYDLDSQNKFDEFDKLFNKYFIKDKNNYIKLKPNTDIMFTIDKQTECSLPPSPFRIDYNISQVKNLQRANKHLSRSSLDKFKKLFDDFNSKLTLTPLVREILLETNGFIFSEYLKEICPCCTVYIMGDITHEEVSMIKK